MDAPMKRIMHYMVVVVALLLSLGLSTTEAVRRNKPVIVSLDAKWACTSFILETSEFLAHVNPATFWKFVDEVSEREISIENLTEKEQYELALEIAGALLSPAQLNLLKLSLSIREFSATIEMYKQISKDRVLPEACDAVVDINGALSCKPAEIIQMIDNAKKEKPATYKIDHYYPASEENEPVAILYGELGTPSFKDFHKMLRQAAMDGSTAYILRHYTKPQNEAPKKTRLAGYGVELDIKSTEYKAQDDTKVEGEETAEDEDEDEEEDVEGFIFSKLKSLHPERKDDLAKLKSHLIESNLQMAPLKVWQLQDLSFQAAQTVLSSPKEEALTMLRSISQNFPTVARSLVRTQVPAQLKNEVKENQQSFENYHGIMPGDSAMFLNGLSLDLEVVDIFTIQDVLRDELYTMEGLWALGLRGDDFSAVLRQDLKQESMEYAIDIRHEAIHWLNDIEKDSQYRDFRTGVHEMLRPTMPGMIRNVRKNFYNIVFLLDPSEARSKDLMLLAETFYVHKAPTRIGLVLVVNTDPTVKGRNNAGVAALEAFNWISKNKNVHEGLTFLNELHASTDAGSNIEVKDIVKLLLTKYNLEDMDPIFGDDSEYDYNREFGMKFLEGTGLAHTPQALMNGLVIDENSMDKDSFEDAMLAKMMAATPEIQRAIYMGELVDSDNVVEFLMTRDHVLPRINKYILKTEGKYLDFSGSADEAARTDAIAFSSLSTRDMTVTMSEIQNYMTRKGDPFLRSVTIWVVGDLERAKGRELLAAAIKHMRTSNDIRLGVVHNPKKKGKAPSMLVRSIEAALATLSHQHCKLFINKLLKEENAAQVITGKMAPSELEVGGMDTAMFQSYLESMSDDFINIHQTFSTQVLGFTPGDIGVIVNGKVVGPLSVGEKFLEGDFALLETHTYKASASKIRSKVKYMKSVEENGDEIGSDLIMKISAICLQKEQTRTRQTVRHTGSEHSTLEIAAADAGAPAFDVVAIVDPASRAAQPLSHLLLVLQSALNANVHVLMNCRAMLSEMPVRSFFRYVLDAEPGFTASGERARGPLARFTELPHNVLLTLNMKVPESWLVASVRARHDLDNIRLEDTEAGVTGEYELEYLLLEGHCYDKTTSQPPRGLQFTLGTKANPVLFDTIVMANLGYFQLKAKPGAWMLRLRDGRSSDIYTISDHYGTDSPRNSSDVITLMDSFKSKIIKVRVQKQAGKENEDLLKEEGDDDSASIWSSISNTLSGEKKKEEEKDQTLNIFSIASGHLYERFLRLMVLSVMKHTNSNVKFWFLKNYLSPQFKESISYMANEYGFEYELVTYKWPRWLHQQTEKQRKIWGYKILFLDVLFPLNVKKIIFVDADQIVRADLQDLADLDLGGAPYGYTPFCDSRRDMDGFRFWKSGYWASHLGHRRYHISALYVIDLKRFRKIAAGDRLRGQYQGLSQDPNSLSNLDQDLPNNMIHQVAIKSLPQEWLWCETWCDDSSKKYAKTIDLCNNPKTKEPKLDSAKRIVPEWTEYDNEIATLLEKFHEEQGSSSKVNAILDEKSTASKQKPVHVHTDL
ncbi:PREDICTED: UDP-glucose:glycoprotein glucosyltransferase 1-like [Priapulus caudatus]|uniref:UDP-glucose:glycoprotein glucosyltransferase 1-like n=1 Tax=Priapulus caudatus TaxID=37621 RepID=A0ABM1EB42_PRICU|nr:PREDICTED: UDP-glucose:glycoprotein glucosyltransferase 1-like [Priapulus caudatus]